MNREGVKEDRTLCGDKKGDVDDRVAQTGGKRVRAIGSSHEGDGGKEEDEGDDVLKKKGKASTMISMQEEKAESPPKSPRASAMFKKGRHIDTSVLPRETTVKAGGTQESTQQATTKSTSQKDDDDESSNDETDEESGKEETPASEKVEEASETKDSEPKSKGGGADTEEEEPSAETGENDDKEEDRSSLLYTDNIAAACAATNESASSGTTGAASRVNLQDDILSQVIASNPEDADELRRRLLILQQQHPNQLSGTAAAAASLRAGARDQSSLIEMFELRQENSILSQHNVLLRQEVEELHLTLAQIISTSFPHPEQQALLLELFPIMQSIIGRSPPPPPAAAGSSSTHFSNAAVAAALGTAAAGSTTASILGSATHGGMDVGITTNLASILARRHQLQQQLQFESLLSDQLLGGQTAAAAAAAATLQRSNPHVIDALRSASTGTRPQALESSSEIQRYLASTPTSSMRGARTLQDLQEEESKVQHILQLHAAQQQQAIDRQLQQQQRDRSNL